MNKRTDNALSEKEEKEIKKKRNEEWQTGLERQCDKHKNRRRNNNNVYNRKTQRTPNKQGSRSNTKSMIQ